MSIPNCPKCNSCLKFITTFAAYPTYNTKRVLLSYVCSKAAHYCIAVTEDTHSLAEESFYFGRGLGYKATREDYYTFDVSNGEWYIEYKDDTIIKLPPTYDVFSLTGKRAKKWLMLS